MDEVAKYIVVEMHSGLCLMDTPIVFPKFIAHSDMAMQLRLADKVLSAGFVVFIDGKPEAFGYSVSLGVKSRETDSKLIARALGIE